MHHLDSLLGVVTLGGLTRQHDAVGTVQNGVANIADLSTGRARVVGHRLEHLGSADNGLAGNVALGDHHLLGNEDLSGRNLDTKVTTGNHDTVGLLQDLVEVVDTLLVLNLGNDLDLLAILAEDLTNGLDVAAAADKRGKDHVDLVLDTEPQVGLVLLGEGGKVNVGLGEVDTLLRRDLAVVQALAPQVLVVHNLEDGERENTVVDVDDAASLDHLGDVLVVDVPVARGLALALQMSPRQSLHLLVVRLGGIFLLGGDDDLITSADGEVLVTNSVASTDLRSFLQFTTR